MKPVCIVGGYRRYPYEVAYAPYENPDLEIWSFNVGARQRKRLDVAFQMHRELKYEQDYLDWLKKITIPVYMREIREEYPTSVAYPFDEVYAMLGHIKQGKKELKDLRFFTSSVEYAIALAVLQGRPRIDVYAIELANNTEYEKQREGYCFWIGFAGGRGIELNIHCGNSIFRKPMYGA